MAGPGSERGELGMTDTGAAIELRAVDDADLPSFFSYLSDPQAQAMASSTVEDGTDPQAFDAYWTRLRRDERAVVRTILLSEDGTDVVVGHIERFDEDGRPYVRYWVDRPRWGRGIATAALAAFLTENPERPVFARQHRSNEASLRVLERNGFRRFGEDSGYDAGRGRMVDDLILRLG